MKSRTLRALLILPALTVMGAVSCTTILGIKTDDKSAATSLCTCPDVVDFFDALAKKKAGDPAGLTACETYVDDALEGATDAQVTKWLNTFAQETCDNCTDHRNQHLICLNARPLCSDEGEKCTDAIDCCGFTSGHDICLAGKCTACVEQGDSCKASDECCGYPYLGNTSGYSPPYCGNGKCVAEGPKCGKTNSVCKTAEECCGYEIGAASCNGRCVEQCDPMNPVNCPGCCARVDTYSSQGQTDPKTLYVCFDGTADQCKDFCEPSKLGCAKGSTCAEQCASPVNQPFERTCFYECQSDSG